jgi:predicted ATP-dependent serine protease
MDFVNLDFKTLGFTGKWLDLVGDPSTNFAAMVFGEPKMGKSYLCIDFAGYLARNHGKVLYVAKEEGLDLTLQNKLNEKNVKHPNLYVASVLPNDLSAYDFIFLDSVSKLGLTPDDLTKLRTLNPTKSFIFIFQTTKQGAFRGANTFQHDVDVVIEVPEKGKAIQMGRFNQGGEMNIFDTDSLQHKQIK